MNTIRVTVAGVRNVSHLVHAHSYLSHLAATHHGPIEVDYLGSGEFLGKDNVPVQRARDLLGLNGRLPVHTPSGAQRFVARPGEQRVLLCIGAPATRAYSQMLRSDPRHPPRVVVVDEGIGTYGDRSTRLAAYRRQGARGPWPQVRAAVVTAADRLLTGTRWALYVQRDGRWQVDEQVAAPIRALLSGTPREPGYAVLLTQPWVDLGLVSASDYLAHVTQIRDRVTQSGLDVWVRPHPAEPDDRYADFEVLAATGPAELDRAVTSADVALGADSTALLNVAALWQTPAARVTMPQLAQLDANLGSDQRALLDSYLPRPVPPEDLHVARRAQRD